MKRIALATTSAVAFLVMSALPALAQYPEGTTVVRGGGGSAGGVGGTAFTGVNVSLGLVIIAALVVASAIALAAGRRRSTAG